MEFELTREQFRKNLDTALFIIDVLEKLRSFHARNNYTTTITSDCGLIDIELSGLALYISAVTFTTYSQTKTVHRVGIMNDDLSVRFCNLISSNTVLYRKKFTDCVIGRFEGVHPVQYPYVHDSEEYFQYSTLYDLLPEYVYQESCDFLGKIKDIEYPVVITPRILEEHHIKAIKDVMKKLEL